VSRAYVIRRLLIVVPSMLGISLLLFTVLALAPGDPFGELASNPAVPPEVRAALRAKFGLDDPVWSRYLHWLVAMLQGDWGFSFVSRMNVDTLILQRLPTTLVVIGSAQLLAIVVAIPVGVLAATRPYSVFDQIASTFAFIGFSLPTFFTGLLLILVFSIQLDWLPFVYRADISATGWRFYWEHIRQSIMPVTVLGLFQGASLVRYVRSAVLDVIRLDYVTTARSKGHPGGPADADRVRRRHRHRADLSRARHRLALDLLDPGERYARGDGRHLRVCLPRRSLQPHGRFRLCLARSPHRFPLTRRRPGFRSPSPSRHARPSASRRGARRGAASAGTGSPWRAASCCC
jgi:peptide/nickel transport system permease protein